MPRNKRKDDDKGFIWLGVNDSDNDRAPYLKGFVKLPPELLEMIEDAETDEEGNVILQVSLWKGEKRGTLSGSVEYREREERRSKKRGTKTTSRSRRERDDDDDENEAPRRKKSSFGW